MYWIVRTDHTKGRARTKSVSLTEVIATITPVLNTFCSTLLGIITICEAWERHKEKRKAQGIQRTVIDKIYGMKE